MKRPLIVAIAALATTMLFTSAGPAAARPRSDTGYMLEGVGRADVAKEAPCPSNEVRTATGEWSKVGAVLCFPKPSGVSGWRLSHDFRQGCSYSSIQPVWTGDCVFAFSQGRYLKVWGAIGANNVYKRVVVLWKYKHR